MIQLRYLIDASELGYEHIPQGVNAGVVTGVDVSYAIRDIATSPTDRSPADERTGRVVRPVGRFGIQIDLPIHHHRLLRCAGLIIQIARAG